jgi:hypothetical protein
MDLERSPRIRDSRASGNRLCRNEERGCLRLSGVGMVSVIADQHDSRMQYILYEATPPSLLLRVPHVAFDKIRGGIVILL